MNYKGDINNNKINKKPGFILLEEKVMEEKVRELDLVEWAREMNLASEEHLSIRDLSGEAIAKILRSWDSVNGLLKIEGEVK